MNPEVSKSLDEILVKHTCSGNELIPVLQEVQERFGYLPEEIMSRVADYLRVPASTVYGVATFYALFKLKPSGKNTVRVCRGTACHVRGGSRILREVEHKLGIKSGETTPDMEYTLETVACIGACAVAPNITINNEVHGQLTTKKIGEILSDRSNKQIR